MLGRNFPCGTKNLTKSEGVLEPRLCKFGIPQTLVSDNNPEFVRGDQKQWCESLGIKKMESRIYHPKANDFAERAIQTKKRPIQA